VPSNFENLPLPGTKDAQDYPRIVPANGTVEIPVIGEFVYCKFSDGDVKVVINGKTTSMLSGDERRAGEGTVFRGVTLLNDTNFDKVVTFVIGFGSFVRRIIQGEVVVDPRVKTERGLFVSDTRETRSLFAIVDYNRQPTITNGSTSYEVAESKGPNEQLLKMLYDWKTGKSYASFYDSSDEIRIAEIDKTGEISSFKGKYFFDGDEGPQRFMAIYDGMVLLSVQGNTQLVAYFPIGGGDNFSPVSIENKLKEAGSTLGRAFDAFFDSLGNLYVVDTDGVIYSCNPTTFDCESLGPRLSAGGQNKGVNILPTYGATWLINSAPDKIRYYDGIFETQTAEFNVAQNILPTGQYVFGSVTLVGGLLVAANAGDDSSSYKLVYIEPESYAEGEIHYGFVGFGCNPVPGIYNKTLESSSSTNAIVTAEFVNGKTYITGEVIKLILQLWGVNVPPDYLDRITGFKAPTKTSQVGIDLGGRTFASDGFEDNFVDVEFPSVVSITALNSLWSLFL